MAFGRNSEHLKFEFFNGIAQKQTFAKFHIFYFIVRCITSGFIRQYLYMTTGSKTKIPNGTKPVKSLTNVLVQSEHVRGMVEEAAEELSSVNMVLKQEIAERGSLPEVENAIQKNKTVEIKVEEAAEELLVVNQALENEVNERHLLEHQLAAAEKQEKAARHVSFHDPLTGLPNRVLFNDRLEHGLAQAKRHNWTLAVMFMDLNGFKGINDTYGHDIGDSVLRAISQRLKENTRVDDTVCRHGGDEFLYVLMEVRDEGDITLITQNILKVIQEPCDVGGLELILSASIGISIFPKDGTTADSLIKKADKAMYVAKNKKSGYAFAQ
ncbi:MAG: diguanylate cyclase domain-containing protein [Thiobacillus sp.]